MRIGHWALVWGTLTFALLAWLYSWRGGSSLLFLGLLVGFILIQGVIAQLSGPTSASIERTYSPLLPSAGTKLAVTLTITLKGGIPPLWLLVEDDLGISLQGEADTGKTSGKASGFSSGLGSGTGFGLSSVKTSGKLLFMGWRRQYTGTYYAQGIKRGVYSEIDMHLTWGDLFGWFMRTMRVKSEAVLIVHPKPLESIYFAEAATRDHSNTHNLSRDAFIPESTLYGRLRDYEAGDPMRHIHWKSSARKGSLLTRVSDQATGKSRYLLLDIHPDSYIKDTFETAVSAAASLLLSENNNIEEILLHHGGLESAALLSGNRGMYQGLDLLADIKLAADAEAAILPSELLFNTGNNASFQTITLITGGLTSHVADSILHLNESGRLVEVWCASHPSESSGMSKEVARLRSFGVPVTLLRYGMENKGISEKGDAKHVIA
ncbi:hypothetical protein D3C76_306220 [compost metagenome]